MLGLSLAVGVGSAPSDPLKLPLKRRCRLSIVYNCVKPSPPSAAPHSNDLPGRGRIRQGKASDAFTMSMLVLSSGMNPLIGDISNFLVFETGEGEVIGGGQIRPGDPGELASLVVKAPWRNRGVGTAIARALVQKEESSRDLCLLCLTRSLRFYSGLGFAECRAEELPLAIRIEQKVGSVAAGIVAPGNEVIGMIRSKRVRSHEGPVS